MDHEVSDDTVELAALVSKYVKWKIDDDNHQLDKDPWIGHHPIHSPLSGGLVSQLLEVSDSLGDGASEQANHHSSGWLSSDGQIEPDL